MSGLVVPKWVRNWLWMLDSLHVFAVKSAPRDLPTHQGMESVPVLEEP